MATPTEISDYTKYRGQCKIMCDALVAEDPSLRLERGHYIDPLWGPQEHWWCVKPDGSIVDPTAKQFPSKGSAEYIPFNGICVCEECGKEVPEEEAIFMGRYPVCSNLCARRLVGV